MPASPERAWALQRFTLDEYRAHLEKLQGLIQSCEAEASHCDADAVGPDEQVNFPNLGVGANANSFEAHYGWVRDALKSARSAGDKARATKLQPAEARLDEDLREASNTGFARADIAAARRRADAILGHPEFATVSEESLWQRILARLALWLDSLFNNVAKFGARSPWIGPVVEWVLVGIALAGLALWAMRALRRQRLAVRVEADRQIEPWEEAARNWRELAEEQAGRGEWREAVHCLYWASIAALEGRRVWAPNRSRTPREYVRLLEAGSARWKLLREQTQGFEHVWYGLRDAGQKDYERALELHEGLRA
jgi:predicted nucleic acid-binding protein